jgi:hypothetical protein
MRLQFERSINESGKEFSSDIVQFWPGDLGSREAFEKSWSFGTFLCI